MFTVCGGEASSGAKTWRSFDVGAPVDREAVNAIGRHCIDCSASFVVLKSDGVSTRLLSLGARSVYRRRILWMFSHNVAQELVWIGPCSTMM